ncbi:MAG: hypothetical protein ACRDYA_24785 [Egibacteraceae bacterium]
MCHLHETDAWFLESFHDDGLAWATPVNAVGVLTLREGEYAALARVATAPREEAEALLLSADRFVRARTSIRLGPAERAVLLRRFGLFGLRLRCALVRQGAASASELAAQLVRRSGLDELREVLGTQFMQRRDLLKARSALLGLDQVLGRRPRSLSCGC